MNASAAINIPENVSWWRHYMSLRNAVLFLVAMGAGVLLGMKQYLATSSELASPPSVGPPLSQLARGKRVVPEDARLRQSVPSIGSRSRLRLFEQRLRELDSMDLRAGTGFISNLIVTEHLNPLYAEAMFVELLQNSIPRETMDVLFTLSSLVENKTLSADSVSTICRRAATLDPNSYLTFALNDSSDLPPVNLLTAAINADREALQEAVNIMTDNPDGRNRSELLTGIGTNLVKQMTGDEFLKWSEDTFSDPKDMVTLASSGAMQVAERNPLEAAQILSSVPSEKVTDAWQVIVDQITRNSNRAELEEFIRLRGRWDPLNSKDPVVLLLDRWIELDPTIIDEHPEYVAP